MSPKINLLPSERAEQAKSRQRTFLAAFLLLAYIGLLAFVFLWVKGRETSAEDALAQQLSANELVQDEINELEPYRILGEQYENGVINLHDALRGDVSWGVLLQDMGRMISDEHVWVESLGVTRMVPTEEAPAFGAVTMSGSGFDYPDVASWLLALDSDDWSAVGASWASSVNSSTVDDISTVTWSIQSSLGEPALSPRADDLTPEVP